MVRSGPDWALGGLQLQIRSQNRIVGRGWLQDVPSPAGDGVLEVTRWTGWYRGAIEAVPKPYRESYLLRGGKSGTWEGKISGPKPGGFGTAAGKPGDHDDPHGWPRQQMPYRGLFPGRTPPRRVRLARRSR